MSGIQATALHLLSIHIGKCSQLYFVENIQHSIIVLARKVEEAKSQTVAEVVWWSVLSVLIIHFID